MVQNIMLDSYSAMKFGEHAGFGQWNCQKEFDGCPDLRFLLFHNSFFSHHGPARNKDLILNP